ncbi:MAG: hypothetical protein JST79_14570 [Acidobacteria bacterium]|jgi:hypothetical protein|nr:hypothetical protein [Acidobacteriota bacterium]
MAKRPFSVIIPACLLTAAGLLGLVYHLREFKVQPFPQEMIWITLVRLLAIIAGTFTFLGRNWARWLALLWIAFHVVLSAFHSLPEFLAHCLFLAVFSYLLLSASASSYFRSTKSAQ